MIALLALSACTPEAVAPSTTPVPTTSSPDTVLPTADTAPTTPTTPVPTADTAPPVEEPYLCPSEADLAKMTFSYRTLNPCVFDPKLSMCLDPPQVDTHENGLRLHQMIRRTDIPNRKELLLYLPPGPGKDNRALFRWAILSGYTMISVGWVNGGSLLSTKDMDAVLDETLHGLDRTPDLDVDYPDSMDGRLETLFTFLLADDPKGGWDAWWDPKTGLRWEDVVLMGWSDGSGAAAHLARDHEVDGVIMISGPPIADWLSDPRATPAHRHQGFYHALEPMAANDTLAENFGPLGMVGPIVDVDTSKPPYGGAQIYTTARFDFQAKDCNHHGAMAVDECIDASLITPYLHILCAAADID